MPNPFRAAAVALVMAIATALTPISASAATPPPPVAPTPAPSPLDILISNYQAQTRCDLTVRPGVADLAKVLSTRYSRPTVYTTRPCGADDSQHYDGRAMDWMLNVNDPADKAIADAVTTWLTAKDSAGNVAAQARVSHPRDVDRLHGVIAAHRPHPHQLLLGRRLQTNKLVDRQGAHLGEHGHV